MALTPDGMFYLGKEDLATERELIGKGIRGMFGLKTKEEAVEDILKAADLDSAEGRQNALNQIKQIDPEQYKFWRNENQKYEQTLTEGRTAGLREQEAKLRLQTAEDTKQAKKNRPLLKALFASQDVMNSLFKKHLEESYTQEELDDKNIKLDDINTITNFRMNMRKLGAKGPEITSALKSIENQYNLKEAQFISDNQFRTDLKSIPTEFKKSSIFESSASGLAPLDTLSDTRKFVAPKEALPVEIPTDDRLAP